MVRPRSSVRRSPVAREPITHQQLTSELPPGAGARGVVLSASKEIEPGARAMVLLADGLFRLDVSFTGDTLRITVRNYSSGALDVRSGLGGYPGENIVFGEAAAYEPSHSDVEFVLGAGQDRVTVSVEIATLRFAERGTIRVSAQGIVREAPEPAPAPA